MSKKSTTFYCFSPAVMFATFLIETVALMYVVWRYKWNEITRLVVLILLALATFQLAEYMVCEGPATGWFTWSRIGYVAITLLPPLGIHLAYAIAGAKKRLVLWVAYPAMVGFIAYFTLVTASLGGHVCAGNYVIFEMKPGSAVWYWIYYFGLLLAGIGVSLRCIKEAKKKQIRRALSWLIVGYSAFIVPTGLVQLINPETAPGIPSIMCGFAVLYAVILVIAVVPAIMRKK